ncbi:MAG: PepSY domain-containing protein [Pirellulaceae bacterium]
MPELDPTVENQPVATEPKRGKRPRKFPRLMMFARRAHLYVGLFLLPWVFLYGITGAMFNHEGLFPDVAIRSVDDSIVAGSSMSKFPSPDQLAQQVAKAIDAAADDVKVLVAPDAGAKFTNNMMFVTQIDGRKNLLHINPHDFDSYVVEFPEQDFQPEKLIANIKNVRLSPNPQDVAMESAKYIFAELGDSPTTGVSPQGFTKLNFLATVDGVPARVTYVLKDGHIDVTKYNGNPGMSPRGFFMRMHTAHGQTPSWTGRMVWSLFVDLMALAMVSWGFTGLLMWWQIKRVRFIGGIVMVASVVVAITMYFAVQHYYATNML